MHIELAIIRRAAHDGEYSARFFEFLTAVVNEACSERRNVRVSTAMVYQFLLSFCNMTLFKPTHEGAMVQLGLNAGPRHARVTGWAKSFNKKLDSSVMVEHDEEIIAALSMTWSITKAVMPKEVIQPIEDSLMKAKLPKVATRNVAEGLYLIFVST